MISHLDVLGLQSIIKSTKAIDTAIYQKKKYINLSPTEENVPRLVLGQVRTLALSTVWKYLLGFSSVGEHHKGASLSKDKLVHYIKSTI